jgi:hypothetical protein
MTDPVTISKKKRLVLMNETILPSRNGLSNSGMCEQKKQDNLPLIGSWTILFDL